MVTGAGGNVEDENCVVGTSEEVELRELVVAEDSVVVDVDEAVVLLLVEELSGVELDEDSGVVGELELEDSVGDGVSVTFDWLLSSAIGMDGAPLQLTR